MKKPLTNQVSSLYTQALVLKTQGQVQRSHQLCDQILQQYPNHYETLVLMGIILSENRQDISALDFFNRALNVKKDHIAYNNRGNLYQNMRQCELAIEDYDKSIKLNPKFTEAYYNKANCYKEQNQWEEAVKWFKQALKCNPKYFHAWNNMGLCYQNLQKFEDALECNRKAIQIDPNNYLIYNNMGFTLHVLMRPDEAIASFNKSIAINPEAIDPKFNVGFVHLLKGDFEKGWAGHEVRWHNKYKPSALPRKWEGEDVYGKRIYIYHEQGLGDTLQFIRYAHQLKWAGAKVIAGVKPEIAELVRSMAELDEIVTDPRAVPEYDYHSPMMSLPYVFKTRVDNIPYEPYLFANIKKIQEISRKMGQKTKMRVGLVWSGGFRADQPEIWAVNERRNISPVKLLPLQNPDVEFYSLQFGAKEMPFPMIDLMGDVKDFSDTAAIIQNLDLLITVDTSTAHVAGAMGKEVWLMNRFDSCWRWLEKGSQTDWYPSFTIYRQEKFNTWDNVVADIKRDLDARAKEFANR